MTNQDDKIILSLINNDGSTAYSISHSTGISIPQVNYRICKLVSDKVVRCVVEGSKSYYYIHPVFKSSESMSKITKYIKSIADTIDDSEYTEPNGMKEIIAFIISRLDVSEPTKECDNDSELIDDFRKVIKEYADKNNIDISDINGWTQPKIEWMALNNRRCGCAPDKRVCPCKEGLEEVINKGRCLCNVFKRKS